jgi:hypothetical protein
MALTPLAWVGAHTATGERWLCSKEEAGNADWKRL